MITKGFIFWSIFLISILTTSFLTGCGDGRYSEAGDYLTSNQLKINISELEIIATEDHRRGLSVVITDPVQLQNIHNELRKNTIPYSDRMVLFKGKKLVHAEYKMQFSDGYSISNVCKLMFDNDDVFFMLFYPEDKYYPDDPDVCINISNSIDKKTIAMIHNNWNQVVTKMQSGTSHQGSSAEGKR